MTRFIDVLGVSQRTRVQVPSKSVAANCVNYDVLSDGEKEGMKRALDDVVRRACRMLLPKDFMTFQEWYRSQRIVDFLVHKEIVKWIQCAKRGSVERRVLRGCLCSTWTAF